MGPTERGKEGKREGEGEGLKCSRRKEKKGEGEVKKKEKEREKEGWRRRRHRRRPGWGAAKGGAGKVGSSLLGRTERGKKKVRERGRLGKLIRERESLERERECVGE